MNFIKNSKPSLESGKQKTFTIASEGQNGSLLTFFPSTVEAKPALLKKERAGFTLIELLVVIAIISLLSSVVLASLSSARASTRDARRVSDFRQFRTAMNLYYNNSGTYPNAGDDQVSANCPNVWIYTELVGGGYLTEMITDPAENSINCSLHTGSSTEEGKFYYGYDYTNNSQPVRACFSIQNFETDSSSLENLNMQDEFTFGGGGGLQYADFVYCFKKM